MLPNIDQMGVIGRNRVAWLYTGKGVCLSRFDLFGVFPVDIQAALSIWLALQVRKLFAADDDRP